MYLVKMRALRPLCGDYGRPNEGDVFSVDNITAEEFEAKGLAARYREPRAWRPMPPPELPKMQPVPENKMLPPQDRKFAGRAPRNRQPFGIPKHAD